MEVRCGGAEGAATSRRGHGEIVGINEQPQLEGAFEGREGQLYVEFDHEGVEDDDEEGADKGQSWRTPAPKAKPSNSSPATRSVAEASR